MVTLRSDNRILTQNAKYAFLSDNYSAGVSTINITSTVGFSVNDIILIGEVGQESSEIFRIGSINASSGDVVIQNLSGAGDTTTYGHSESSKVYQLSYDEIRFYWTAATGTISDETPTFGTSNPLTGWTSLDPTSWYTTYSDTTNSTGFGWFVYQNSITADTSSNSNPIPYAGFSANTVAAVFTDFDSLLNVNELKLVTIIDKFSWLNEALTLFKNKLNLSNVEYTVSIPQSISILSGTAEYQLPADFSDVVSIVDGQNTSTARGYDIPYMSLAKIQSYQGDTTHYYLRGRYIGFVPTPGISTTYYYRYRANSTRVVSLSDYINLPDGAFYALKSWMLYRAGLKFNNPNARIHLQDFNSSVDLYIQAGSKRDSNLDTWGIAGSANT